MLKLFSKEIQIVAVTVVVFLTHQLAIEKKLKSVKSQNIFQFGCTVEYLARNLKIVFKFC